MEKIKLLEYNECSNDQNLCDGKLYNYKSFSQGYSANCLIADLAFQCLHGFKCAQYSRRVKPGKDSDRR